MGFESFRKDHAQATPPVSLEDFKDSPQVYRLLATLPPELRTQHMVKVEMLPDEEAIDYLQSIHEKREAASRESVVSDEQLQSYFEKHGEEVWQDLDTRVLQNGGNQIGSGQTARIKRYHFEQDVELPAPEKIAVKYLVTPTEKTLSVSSEHDLLEELERIQKIEQAEWENASSVKSIKVPHPYFYHRTSKVQCYGMEEIDGIDLLQGTNGAFEGAYTPELRQELLAALENVSIDDIAEEIERFFDAMHTVCLHGDIKPANLMVARDGTFYLIDFGQSVLATSIDDKSGPAFENLKDEEKRNAMMAIRYFLDALKRPVAQAG